MTSELTGRAEGLRYEIEADEQTWWELGWDRALASYFAQRWHAERDVDVTDWHGTAPAELPDLAALESAIGREIPEDIRAELEADRAAAALRQGRRT